MPRSKAKVESALLGKGFRKAQGDHRYFVYISIDGQTTTAHTKVSHSPKMKTISDGLLGQMAKQCHLSRPRFLELADCPLDRAGYEVELRQQGKLPIAPDQS